MRLEEVDAPYAVVTTFTDVTELRKSAERVRNSEARLQRVFAASKEGYLEWRPGSGMVERSPRLLDMVGLRASEVPGNAGALFSHLHPDDAERMRKSLKELAAGGADVVLDYRIRHEDGSWRWLEARAGRQVAPDGEVIVSAAVSDVTARHEAEEHLHAQVTRNEELIKELTLALEQVKALRGLLPICMYCHKIRDEQGTWSQLEQYIVDRTDAAFSHGMCPDCLEQHYPDHEKNGS